MFSVTALLLDATTLSTLSSPLPRGDEGKGFLQMLLEVLSEGPFGPGHPIPWGLPLGEEPLAQGEVQRGGSPQPPPHRKEASLLVGQRCSRTEEVIDLVVQKARAYGVPLPLALAVVKVESDFRPDAISPKGAMGLMQLMPTTAEELRVKDPFDPEENLEAGLRYLKGLIDRFQGDIRLALAAYNAGPEAVKRWGDVPPYPETQAYVRKVLTEAATLMLASLKEETPPLPTEGGATRERPMFEVETTPEGENSSASPPRQGPQKAHGGQLPSEVVGLRRGPASEGKEPLREEGLVQAMARALSELMEGKGRRQKDTSPAPVLPRGDDRSPREAPHPPRDHRGPLAPPRVSEPSMSQPRLEEAYDLLQAQRSPLGERQGYRTVAPTAVPLDQPPPSAPLQEGVPPPPAPPPLEVVAKEVIFQVVQGIRVSVERGVKTLDLQLKPEFMGGLRIEVALAAGGLKVHLSAQTHEAQQLLRVHLTEIRKGLEGLGFKVEGVQVSLVAQAGAESRPPWERNHEKRRGPSRERPAPYEEEESKAFEVVV